MNLCARLKSKCWHYNYVTAALLVTRGYQNVCNVTISSTNQLVSSKRPLLLRQALIHVIVKLLRKTFPLYLHQCPGFLTVGLSLF